MVIIWPLQAKLHTLFSQQRMRAFGNLAPPKPVVNKPWNAQSIKVSTPDSLSAWMPTVVHQLLPQPAYNFTISGITKDSTGAVLGSCTVNLFDTSTNTWLATTTSDATTGVYTFPNVSRQLTRFAVTYKSGSPDVAGTTVNTLVGT